ncbi:MAG: cupin domain-containing protein [Acidimicrobiales bacterium]
MAWTASDAFSPSSTPSPASSPAPLLNTRTSRIPHGRDGWPPGGGSCPAGLPDAHGQGPPWSIRIEDRAPLTLLAVARGEVWILPDNGAAARVGAGDVAIVRGPDHYTVADDPATAPGVVVHPGPAVHHLSGRRSGAGHGSGGAHLGQHRAGGDGAADRHLRGPQRGGSRLLGALPVMLVVRADEWDSPLLGLLSQEVVRDHPGQEVVSRPAPRSRPHRRRAGMVRPVGGQRAGVVAGRQ